MGMPVPCGMVAGGLVQGFIDVVLLLAVRANGGLACLLHCIPLSLLVPCMTWYRTTKWESGRRLCSPCCCGKATAAVRIRRCRAGPLECDSMCEFFIFVWEILF